MKKTIAFAAVGALAIASLAACSDSSASSEPTKATASSDVAKTAVESKATCVDAKGKANDLVSEATLTGDKTTLTVAFKLKDAAAFAEAHKDFSGQAVVVGTGGAPTDTLKFDFAAGQFAANEDAPSLKASIEGDTLTVKQDIAEFAAPATIPGTWFAKLVEKGAPIVQCGVFGDSVAVK